ncbi:mRNA capping enzyme alpha subunit-like protein [Podospora appendiculata]|uniref:mRNA-capping enzyme subunit alpha n=1 Tax=Podospora appendiculata TaxID=314037 RepID=A0AAE0XGB1_9PEZI|nr:mRNA capping enzyme alpha subunit-like protein [Podospora appendiculata]
MWNDEDNNPYGETFERRDSFTSSSANPSSPISRDYDRYDPPHTPSTPSDEAPPRPSFAGESSDIDSDEEPDAHAHGELVPRRKPGGYDSRVEQMLYENPELPVLIIEAGKSVESGGRYIVYTIKTAELVVRRRYSEFASLREALTRLHPTLIIPPIPEKHTVADYAANPTNAKQDQQIIDLRKRMLAVFLNRCRRMEQVRTDGVWWRFLDPNSSWTEVLHSHPVASIPKSIMKAPPLDTANPTPGHNFLPVPASSARLKTGTGADSAGASPQALARFPPDSNSLSEQDLDPYFTAFEASIKELESLLVGPIEKVNRRTLNHLSSLGSDLAEMGARYNAFALSEKPNLALATERIGQAADSSYIATEELSNSLGASFAEPMRENAQFAGVVRNVLRYRVLKRVQQDMTTDELNKKRSLLDQLERSEAEARRIDQYLSSSQQIAPPRRSTSVRDQPAQHRRDGSGEDTASIDSDFPPTHGDFSSAPSAKIGAPERAGGSPGHKKAPSGNSITNKIFGPIRHAVQGVVDVDPERTRRDMIGKTRESIGQLEQAQVASAQDVKDASASILKDLKRFQREKEDDLKRYMLAYAKSQIEWGRKNKETWEEARAEVDKIDESSCACLNRDTAQTLSSAPLAPFKHTHAHTMYQGAHPIQDIHNPGIKAQSPLARTLREEVAALLQRTTYGFPGAQPVSFARNHLEELRKEDYYVCEKSDGIRYLLYLTVDENGEETQYLIDRKNDFWWIHQRNLHFPLQNDTAGFHRGTLIDGELVMDSIPGGGKEPKFLVFDLLALDGKADLRFKPLDKRLGYFREHVMKPYKKLFQDFPDEAKYQAFKVEMKEMQVSYGIEMMFREVLPSLKHQNDGLIFTCRTSPYQFGTDNHILKWKAPHDNTIDFRLRLHFPEVEPTDAERAEGITEPFIDYDSVPEARLIVFHGSDRGEPAYQQFNEPLYLADDEWDALKAMGDPLQDRVVECCLDDEGRWRLYRFRDDKNEANHISTVASVLGSIKDGITETDLLNSAKGIKDSWKLRQQQQQQQH